MQSQARFGMNLWDQVKTGTRVSHPFQQKGPGKKASSDQLSETEQGDGQAGGAEPTGASGGAEQQKPHTLPSEQAGSFFLSFFLGVCFSPFL